MCSSLLITSKDVMKVALIELNNQGDNKDQVSLMVSK